MPARVAQKVLNGLWKHWGRQKQMDRTALFLRKPPGTTVHWEQYSERKGQRMIPTALMALALTTVGVFLGYKGLLVVA